MSTILTILLPMLMSLFTSKICPTPPAAGQTPQDFLKDHFNETDNTFDPHLVQSLRRPTKRAARKAHQKVKSWADIDKITVDALTKAMASDGNDEVALAAQAPFTDDDV